MGSYVRTVKPAALPFSVMEAKQHLRLTTTDDDAWVFRTLRGLTDEVENYLNRALITQQWTLRQDSYWSRGRRTDDFFPYVSPAGLRVDIYRCPLQSVQAFKYIDMGGVTQTLDPTQYQLDIYSEPARIIPAFGIAWPVPRPVLNAVQIDFTAGYGADTSTVPEQIINGMKLLLGDRFENREAQVERPLTENAAAMRCLDPHRVRSV